MFRNCAIMESPVIHLASIGAMRCMANMFLECSQLKKITVMFNEWVNDSTVTNPTHQWVKGTGGEGEFVCPDGLEEMHDMNHIPVGWEKK